MGDRRDPRPRAKGKRGGRVLRFAIGGSLLMAPLTAGCPEERGPNVNEPAPEPADPPAEETVNEPDPGPDRDRPIKVNEFPPDDESGEGEGGGEGASEG